jgi:LemA protein
MEPLLALLAVLVLLGGWLVYAYNRFVTQVAAIDASWSGIDVELQRRHELIPNLVATVQGYARHERQVLEAVTEARARAVSSRPDDVPLADQARAEDGLTEQVTRLLALAEGFPELRADRGFRDLQRQLVETEDRIAASRRLYNLEVAAYERRRRSVPSNLVANRFGFERREMFEIRDASAAHAVHLTG